MALNPVLLEKLNTAVERMPIQLTNELSALHNAMRFVL